MHTGAPPPERPLLLFPSPPRSARSKTRSRSARNRTEVNVIAGEDEIVNYLDRDSPVTRSVDRSRWVVCRKIDSPLINRSSSLTWGNIPPRHRFFDLTERRFPDVFRKELQHHHHGVDDASPSGHVHESHQGDRGRTERAPIQNE